MAPELIYHTFPGRAIAVADLPLGGWGGGEGPTGAEFLGWAEGSEEVPHLSKRHTFLATHPPLQFYMSEMEPDGLGWACQ